MKAGSIVEEIIGVPICKELKLQINDLYSLQKDEDIAKAFQFGLAFGFGKRYDEMDRVVDEIKKVTTPQPQPKTA